MEIIQFLAFKAFIANFIHDVTAPEGAATVDELIILLHLKRKTVGDASALDLYTVEALH